MGYDLIAFDMDGTLLDSNKKVRQDSLIAIEQAISAGKIVTLSTGRCLVELDEFDEQFKNLQYYIYNSGANIWDNKNKKDLVYWTIPKDTVMQILNITKSYHVMPQLLTNTSIVPKIFVANLEEYHMGEYQDLYDRVTFQVDSLEDYYLQNPTIPVYKFNFYLANIEERYKIRDELELLDINAVFVHEHTVECSPKGISKGSGLKALCEHLNIPIERSIAVGDSDNDLEIFKAAGLALAMGNANDHAKDLANAILKDNDNGGCAQAIEEYLLP